MTLAELGWDAEWARAFEPWAALPGLQPARVAIEFNHIFRVSIDGRDLDASTTGRLKHRTVRRSELPAVGDWVALEIRPQGGTGAIVGVLPRRSWFSRKAAGSVTGEQIVAANVDVIFVVMALDADYSLRRLERYLLLARESGAAPVVLLTKPDLAEDAVARASEAAIVAGDAPVHVLTPKMNIGLEQVDAYLKPGKTAALLGSSGVGKSTIINRLAGDERQRTREVREADSKGRHTTSHRELILLPGGGLIIDTPGMRELQLWDVSDAVRDTFDEVVALAGGCHFTNCRHRNEPRCAVKAAVEAGALTADRLESYVKLQEEMAQLERQQDERALLDEKRRSRRPGG